MYRVTTPTHTFTLPDTATNYSVIQITYKQRGTVLTKTYEDGTLPDGMSFDDTDVILTLSQEETALFAKGTAYAQVRVLTESGKSFASEIFSVTVKPVLNSEVLE